MPDTVVLTVGDRGSQVAALQQALTEQGFACGDDPADVVFGPATQSAVKLFQACHVGPYQPLVVDGIVGPNTWWALDHPSGEAQSQPTSDLPPQEASNPVAKAALDSARSELALDVREVPDGSNRGDRVDLYTGMEGKPLTLPGPSWCAYFVSWNFAKVPGGSPFGRIGGAQSVALYCLKHVPGSVSVNGQLSVDQQVGTPAVGFVAKPGDVGVIAEGQVHGHTFHVEAVQGDTVWTIEGNCGNAVRRRKRSLATLKFLINFDDWARSSLNYTSG